MVISSSFIRRRAAAFAGLRRLALVLLVSLWSIVALAAAASAKTIPLQAGENQGTADGFVGTTVWTVNGRPGALEIRVMSGQNANNTFYGANFSAQLKVLPHSQVKNFSFQKIKGGFLFTGHPTVNTQLALSVIPQTSTLVRNATTYTITTSGALVYGTANGGDPIVGTYTGMTQGQGLVKFLPGGKIITSNGDSGTWVLFDAESHTYAVTLGQTKYTVKNVPGQGLLNSTNGNIEFQASK